MVSREAMIRMMGGPPPMLSWVRVVPRVANRPPGGSAGRAHENVGHGVGGADDDVEDQGA